MEFIIINEKEFIDIENSFSNSNYYQTTNWAHLKKITGWQSIYVAVKEKNKIISASLILMKKIFGNKYIYYAPRGFLCDFSNYKSLEFFTSKLKEYVRDNNGIFLKIDPLVEYSLRDNNGDLIKNINSELVNYLKRIGFKHNGFTKGFGNDIQYRWSYYLQVRESFDEFLMFCNKRCKRCLKKANNYPLIIRDVDESNFLDFKNIMEHTAIRHGCYDRSLDYYKSLKKYLKDQALFKIAYLDRKKYLDFFVNDKLYDIIKNDTRAFIPLSAGVFIKDSNFVHYVYGGAYEEYMSLMSQYKIQVQMIEYAYENGLNTYDFGGISGIFSVNSPNYGIYEFKRGFGGYVVEYIGEFDLVVMPLYYRLFKIGYFFYKKLKILKLHVMFVCKFIYKELIKLFI